MKDLKCETCGETVTEYHVVDGHTRGWDDFPCQCDLLREEKSHGGRRRGSGRKPGKKTVSKTISMPSFWWDKFDADRGDNSRGCWLTRIMRRLK